MHKVITYMDICVRTYARNELIYNQAPGALKPPDLAPPPTCPFILLSQCQRADRQKSGHLWFPDIATRGVGDLFVGDQTAETLASRPVNRPLEGVSDSVNSHLQFYYKKNAVGHSTSPWQALAVFDLLYLLNTRGGVTFHHVQRTALIRSFFGFWLSNACSADDFNSRPNSKPWQLSH